MKNQPKARSLSKSNDKKLKKSSSSIHVNKKVQKQVKKTSVDENNVFSPKTISYKKVMERHGNIDTDNSYHNEADHSCRQNYVSHRNQSVYDVNSFRKILDDYDFLNDDNLRLKSLLDKEKNKVQKLEEKIMLDQPKLNNNYKEIDSLKEKNYNLENELSSMKTKHQHWNQTIKERILLMIQLFKKNVKKLFHLTQLLYKEDNNKTPSKELIMKDFNVALEAFNKILSNPKITNIFEKEATNVDLEGVDENDYSHFEIIKKLENKCKKLEKERQRHLESSEKYMLKYNDLKVNFEETQKQLNQIKKLKTDIDKNYTTVKQENDYLKNELNNMKEQATDYEDKIQGLMNEIKFKSSKIEYYDSIRQQQGASNNNFASTMINTNHSNRKGNVEEASNNEALESRQKLNVYKDYLNNSNGSFNKYKENLLSNSDVNVFSSNEEIDMNKKCYVNSPSDFNMSKTSSLKKDIDYLDNEINQLQGKLRTMIDLKK